MYYWDVEKVFLEFKNKVIGKKGSLEVKMDKSGPSIVDIWRKSLYVIQVVKLGSLVTPLLVNKKVKSQWTRQIPVQEVPMRFTDDIFDFR